MVRLPGLVRVVKELVEISDVVVENMRPGKIAAMGLSYDEIRKVRPDIIMLSSSASGAAGPEGSYVGYAPTFCAVGGLAYISGYPDGAPTALSGAVDLKVGATAAFAVIAALVHRQQTGEGQFIDLSSSEAIASLAGHTFLDYSAEPKAKRDTGSKKATIASSWAEVWLLKCLRIRHQNTPAFGCDIYRKEGEHVCPQTYEEPGDHRH